MTLLIYILVGLVAALAALAAYVRLAPIDTATWHDPKLPALGSGKFPAASGYVDQRALDGDGQAMLARLDEVIRATPRTGVVAGAVDAGRITYITRSASWGFPDFTTVTLAQVPSKGASTLQVFGRLRFGKSDLGVKRARIEGWLAKAQQDTPSP